MAPRIKCAQNKKPAAHPHFVDELPVGGWMDVYAAIVQIDEWYLIQPRVDF